LVKVTVTARRAYQEAEVINTRDIGLRSSARDLLRGFRRRLDTLLPPHSDLQLGQDAADYWQQQSDDQWRNNSHWRDGSVFRDREWFEVGREHLELFRMLARTVGAPQRFSRVIEWGCGGGANAVHFAPLADEFIAADISRASVAECRRQVVSVCKTPVREIVIDPKSPESSIDAIGTGCELLLCLYVIELVPSKTYGARILDLSHRLLRPGGLAFVQVKYTTTDRLSRPVRRRYVQHLANMTTYAIDEFWTLAEASGFEPIALTLVPRNALDERYAYYLLRKGDSAAVTGEPLRD
jgi:SAM-dependent methyltransferase